MNPTKTQAAQTLADAVRDLIRQAKIDNFPRTKRELTLVLAAYEASPEQGPEPAPEPARELLAAADELHHQVYIQLVETFCREDHFMKPLAASYERYAEAKKAKPPQPEAKPGDWMRAADNLNARANQLIDIYNYGDQHEQQKARELLFDAKEAYYAVRSAHCQNAGDAQITAKELISRLANFHGNGSPLMNMARMALKDIQSERAKASQTP